MPTPALDAAASVQLIVAIGGALAGLSHIVQPGLWRETFAWLHGLGFRGIVIRTFLFDLWPGLLIVSLHPVWTGPEVIVTSFGWLLLGKAGLSLLAPQLGLRSLAMAQGRGRPFLLAGFALLALASTAVTALLRQV